jgi:hypothetical protein
MFSGSGKPAGLNSEKKKRGSMEQNHFWHADSHSGSKVRRVLFMLSPSRDVWADAGFLRDKAMAVSDAISGTRCRLLPFVKAEV